MTDQPVVTRIWTGVEVCECGHYKFFHEGDGTCGSWRERPNYGIPRARRGYHKRCLCQKFVEAK